MRLLSFARGKKSPPAHRAARIRVLVVDDEEPMRRFVQEVLTEAGYETALASDGDDAIGVAAGEQLPFDLLVTDEMMPRMAGHQLARYMRERYLDIKVLYLTGYRDSVFDAKGSLWADEAFLDKPCSPEGLRQAVAQLLFGRLLTRDPQRAEVLAGHPRDV